MIIKLNKSTKTISLLNQTKVIKLTQVGRRGPQGPPGTSTWGSIKGTLSDQTDLQDALDAKQDLADKGMPGGYSPLDDDSLIPAPNMRPYNDRGVLQPDTEYHRWDMVVYRGRRILVTRTATSGGGPNPFFSASNYVNLEGEDGSVKAHDFGFRADGSQGTASANVAALQAAIDHVAGAGGGMVVLPRGYAFIDSTITVKDRVWIVGPGMMGLTIALADNSNCHGFVNYVSQTGTSGDPNAQFIGLSGFCIDGRKDNQNGAGPYYGVYLNTNPFNTVGGDPYFDPTHVLEYLRISNWKGTGLYINGRSDIRVVGVKSSFNLGYGFRSSFDTVFLGCDAEKNLMSGFHVSNSSVRFIGCKSYLAGVDYADADRTQAHGFSVDSGGEIIFSGCDAQEVFGDGFHLVNCGPVSVFGMSSKTGFSGNSNPFDDAGVALHLENVINSNVSLQVQKSNYALRLLGTSSLNKISMVGSYETGVTAPGSIPYGDNTVFAFGQQTFSGLTSNGDINLGTNKINIGTGSASIGGLPGNPRIFIDGGAQPIQLQNFSELFMPGTNNPQWEMFSSSNRILELRNEGTGAGHLAVRDGNFVVGLGTPTHQLTLSSAANGMALYNTSDQATNYERGILQWNSNVLELRTENGGSGVARGISIQAAGITLGASSNDVLTLNGTGSNNVLLRLRDDGIERGAIYHLNGSSALNIRSQGDITLISNNGSTPRTLNFGASEITMPDAVNLSLGTTTGTKIGSATTQKLAFWNATPVEQQVLATGAGASVDDVISFLQTIGLCRQS